MTLEIENASFGHRADQPIISDLSLRLAPGEIMAVLGPNGAGKTTLLNAITGMIRWQKGRSLLHGKPLTDYPQRLLWQQMGYVPQARNNAFSYSVLDMVLLGRSAHLGTFGRPGAVDRLAARRVLERLEIAHLESSYCNTISGGELQLVFIARALLAEPSVLFLDEPESHLDFKKQLIILDIIERLAREDGIICVLNTHFPNHALRIAHKVLLMASDRSHRFGPAREVLTEDTIRDCFGVNAVLADVSAGEQTHRAIYPVSLVPAEPTMKAAE